ncbi:MAG: class I SAM-dependent RNA methyltransferase, partial [Deltaproteobacteria bacterium]|nr:class I SAM-dependent RNA methyltransferase [Deltaproteobacteria bacterium]
MMFQYNKSSQFFAQIADGLTEIATEELAGLGARDIRAVYRGLHFTADHETLYRINYQTRLCSKISAALLTFDCHSTKYLYKTAIKIPWNELLDQHKSFCISSTVVNSHINNSQYAALCLKDAIVDYFREQTGTRPNVDRRTPDLWLDLYISENQATISLDT